MEELREADEEELWLRMQAFPKRRGVRVQVPREMIVVMELVKIGAVKATSVAQRYTQDIWDAIQEAWLRHCKWVESIEDRIGISQVVKEKKDKKQRIEWAEKRMVVDDDRLRAVKGEVTVIPDGTIKGRQKARRKVKPRENMMDKLRWVMHQTGDGE